MMLKYGRHKIHDDSYVEFFLKENVHFLLYKEYDSFKCMQGKWW